ncbi:hypothetical protein GC197_13195 [bacterium]|nr:hypothetical protein [bacterium]
MNSANPFSSPMPEPSEGAYVRADVHRGTTLAWLVDRYEFFVPEIVEVVPTAIAFYERTGAKVTSHDPLTFWRGNLWATVMGPERYARQEIVLEIDPSQLRVNLSYRINLVLPSRFFFNSHREAIRLATDLGAIHPDAIGQ